jgi:hypothetical protein
MEQSPHWEADTHIAGHGIADSSRSLQLWSSSFQSTACLFNTIFSITFPYTASRDIGLETNAEKT